MFWKNLIIQLIFISLIFVFFYAVLKKYVLVKFNPNKKIILTLSIIVFLIPSIIEVATKTASVNPIIQYTSSALFVILFLWFLDLHNGTMNVNTRNKKKDIKIRPKPKPNRVKNKKR
ncbi:hypothetical protein H2684_02095 [Clostridium sp. cel8]|jgi:hypothetical protein|uniref:hypothetical protein n=1 Tax=Clostridium sp. cel8 TaxID=2663123 RepID=UPI0015F3EFD7|nr:hypothetical protein [Clostridium sp. cel8]MBA5850110.1 hypothetical protein [Clostridium sp. cel8]